jgi:hypothetical protein
MEKRVLGMILSILGIAGIIFGGIAGAIFFFAGIGLIRNTNDKAS